MTNVVLYLKLRIRKKNLLDKKTHLELGTRLSSGHTCDQFDGGEHWTRFSLSPDFFSPFSTTLFFRRMWVISHEWWGGAENWHEWASQGPEKFKDCLPRWSGNRIWSPDSVACFIITIVSGITLFGLVAMMMMRVCWKLEKRGWNCRY